MEYVKKRIEELRKKKRISNKDFAIAVGHTPGWYTNLKSRPNSEIKPTDLQKIAEILDVRIEELFPGPKIFDINKMSLIDLIRHICKSEIEGYLKEHGVLKK